MSDVAVKVEGLSKRYRIGVEEEQYETLFGALSSWVKSPVENYRRVKRLSSFGEDEADDIIWALEDVSFEVERGEVVGVIGRNGAGKSTLLKILSHITEPTSGYAKIRGCVSSLLEVGTGFHPELTGRENVYLNGTILGMSKAEVDRKFDEIVAFSGVEKFIDTPVKRYSSGMKVRLAFAVAAHLEPEILLVDEVLAVGDAEFQRKCLGKMDEVARGGRTVLFVSHQMEAVANLCSRTIFLKGGRVKKDGDTEEVIGDYLSDGEYSGIQDLSGREDRKGEGQVRFVATWVEDRRGNRNVAVRSGDPITIVAVYEVQDQAVVDDLNVSFALSSAWGTSISDLNAAIAGDNFRGDVPKCGKVRCHIPSLPLNAGRYFYNIYVESKREVQDWIQHVNSIDVQKGDFFGSGKMPGDGRPFLIDQNWQMEELPPDQVQGSEALVTEY